jgi:hypothetical protein
MVNLSKPFFLASSTKSAGISIPLEVNVSSATQVKVCNETPENQKI